MSGTIIAGTHRPEDTIPAFMEALEEREEMNRAGALREEFSAVFAYMRRENFAADGFAFAPAETRDDIAYLLAALADELDEVAPPGTYFGAHPGDGSDFGFWPATEEAL